MSCIFSINLYANYKMNMQINNRQKFSYLRQSFIQLANEVRRTTTPFLSDHAVIKGSVYEIKRKCGKPGCKCAQGELHGSMVVSASRKGKSTLRVIPGDLLLEVQGKVRRYRELRKARARLVTVHREMLRVMDEIEALRRQEMPEGVKSSSRRRA
jgi:hypothetical protein